MSDTLIGAYIGIGSAILGALIAGPVAYYYSQKLIRQTHQNALQAIQIDNFNKAALGFRNAFLPEITFLKYNANIGGLGHSDKLFELLRFGYIDRHLRAFETFKIYLTSRQREAITQAWQEYCYHPDHPHAPFFEQYSWIATNKGKSYEDELKKLALNRIEKILSFAEPK